MAQPKQVDIAIVGGGMAGATLALALAPLCKSIAIIEAHPPGVSQPSFDDRSVALSFGSQKILQAFDLWSGLADEAASIEHIHVSDRGHLGLCRLHAADEQQSALGYVIENRVIGQALYQRLASFSNIKLIAPAELQSLAYCDEQITVTYRCREQSEQLSAKLLVAADGSNSKVATELGISRSQVAYPQQAVIANIATEPGPNGWAFERFTEQGPIALLPLTKQRYSLVWTLAPDSADAVMQLSDAEFCSSLQQNFGFRAGRIVRVGERHCFPLSRQTLSSSYAKRAVFVGNALHTGHPVAGQGFNLGLRDIAELVELLAIAAALNVDFGNDALLRFYGERRKDDIHQTLMATDALVRLFSTKLAPLALVRNSGLAALSNCSWLRHQLASTAMGLRHDLPAVARGVPLAEVSRQPKYHQLKALTSAGM
ncbi:MAG: 2-octaprenyl-6-methoxyphenyl hydroxylase [Gammaproteobacteria bacterium]|nr:2-octaprenyl-6-methoxyphenyl hydroxylase [Gammaproteobacteria bacterium]NVK86630.1 2-octaprenyl-6-methoxyphenyl hydroxylase [Gammaproteobacteria bacterium]